MTVDFALFLSPQGIALAHRQSEGHWALVGEVPFESADLAEAMAGLKAQAVARAGKPAPVLVVLPDDQILYTSFMAPVENAALVEARILEGLDGLTPYAVADLVHDWRPIEVDRVKVAVIAQETLDEAAGFATEHGFKIAGFAAMPPRERFPGMPIFGKAPAGLAEREAGFAFGPDTWVDPARIAPTEVAVAADGTTDLAAQAPEAERDESEARTEAPKPQETPEAPPVALAETLAKPVAEAVAEGAEAIEPPPAPLDAAPEQTDSTPAAGPEGEASASLAELLDPMLERAIIHITDSTPPDVPVTGGAEAAPQSGEPAGPSGPEVREQGEIGTPAPPVATRGKVARPGSEARSLTAAKPGAAARPPKAQAEPTEPPSGTEAEQDGPVPFISFGARRGRAPAKSQAETDAPAPSRRPRLDFGSFKSEVKAEAVHPDAAPLGRASDNAGRPGSRLAAQLARVRDASKQRGAVETSGALPTPGAPRPSAYAGTDDAAAMPAVAPSVAPQRKVAGILRSGSPAPAPAANAAPASGGMTADAAFASGLLARKPGAAAGPSLRTGLVLTVLLLVLLVLIAIWSVVFLPDSPAARLFGAGSGQSEIARTDAVEPAQTGAAVETGVVETGSATGVTLAALAPDAPGPASAIEAEALADGQEDNAEAIDTTPAPAAVLPALPPVAALPDIDADLDLPPLPPLPEEALPSLEETERFYAEDGIWPRPPERPGFSPFTLSDDIYIASIDPEVTAFDAVALADPQINIAETLRAVPPPPAFGLEVDRDARGLVVATAEGVLTPEGAFVILGRPPVAAQPRPREIVAAAPPEPVFDVENAVLRAILPRPRPENLQETRERQILGGLSVTELAARRPTERPASAQEAAAGASLFPQEAANTDPAAPGPTEINGTERAIAISRVPVLRPENFAAIVAAATPADTAQEVVVAVAANAIAAPPSIPSNADVARAATQRNEIRLREVNLIGVSGTPSNRTALVRLPSGRFVRVSVGDRLDGGRVAAIGEDSLQYIVNGRNVTLDIPG